jgi:hypothetical protein
MSLPGRASTLVLFAIPLCPEGLTAVRPCCRIPDSSNAPLPPTSFFRGGSGGVMLFRLLPSPVIEVSAPPLSRLKYSNGRTNAGDLDTPKNILVPAIGWCYFLRHEFASAVGVERF